MNWDPRPKNKSGHSTSIHPSLLPDCGSDVTSCLTLLTQRLSTTMAWTFNSEPK